MTEKLERVMGMVIVPLFAVLATSFVTYDVFFRTQDVKNEITISKYWVSNSSQLLTDFDDRIELFIDKRKVENVTTVFYTLENTGKLIDASNIKEKIKVKVDDPWQLIGVVTADNKYPKSLPVKWNVIDSQTVELDLNLFNPGDRFRAAVHVTKTDESSSLDHPVNPTWSARIDNMSDLELVDSSSRDRSYFIDIEHNDWYMAIFIVMGLVLASLTLRLLYTSGLIPSSSMLGWSLIYISIALSISSGSLLTTFIRNPNHYYFNMVPVRMLIVAHVIFAVYFCVRRFSNSYRAD